MNLQECIDPTVGEMGAPDPVPAGEYTCTITNSEEKSTKKGDGKYLKVELEIVDGEYKGRKVYSNLNLWNPNAQAVQIAKQELNTIIAATGVQQPKDSSQLHGIPILVRVGQEKSEYQGEERINNVIKGYRSRHTAKQPTAQQTTGASQWMKK